MFGAVALSAVLSLAASPTSAGATAAATVTTKSFARQFAPDEVVAARGEIWLVSAGNGNGPGCRAGRLDPAAMVVSTYRLASCGWNLTVGGGALYLETSVADVKHQAYLVHIERFSLSTHRSVVFRAVSVTMFLGSDIAHTQLAYADSSLWLYTMPKGSHSTALLKLSPTDGHV